jgi:hypothetical protein
MRLIVMMALPMAMMGCGSYSKNAAPFANADPTTAVQEFPTKEKPIVVNTTTRGGGLVFGGVDGVENRRIEFGDRMIRAAISPNGKRAATLSYDWKRTEARWVTFFDESGEALNNVMLPPPPVSRQRLLPNTLSIVVSDAPEAFVIITRVQYHEGPVRPEVRLETSGERFHVSVYGHVQAVAGDATEQTHTLLPDSGGMVLLRTSGEVHRLRPWTIERYDEGFKLRWRKEIEADWIGFLKSKYDFSVIRSADQVREFLHFHADGTSETEP